MTPLRRLLRRGARAHATNLLSKLHGADVARLLSLLDESEVDEVFGLLLKQDLERAGQVLAEMEASDAGRILEARQAPEIARILAQLDPDDAAGLAADLPEDTRAVVLDQLERAGYDDVEDLLQYDEETAGRIMSPEVFALHEDLTVGEAIEELRARSADLEMVFYLYVIDGRGHLVGVCSLRDLLLRSPEERLDTVMQRHVVAVSVDTDQEEVAKLVARYNYLALPVVDHGNKLAGIITVDDVIDIMREEETEDILLMAGLGEDEEEVLTASLWRNLTLRLPWLFAAWVGGVLAAQVIRGYAGLLDQIELLVWFMPVIIGMGGNIGTQAATIVVRGMATGRLSRTAPFVTVFREMRLAFSLGGVFGTLLFGAVLVMSPGNYGLAIAVGLSLISCMSIAATVGASVPIVLNRLGVDPAIATGPFVTTSIDVLGIATYFTIARLLVLS